MDSIEIILLLLNISLVYRSSESPNDNNSYYGKRSPVGRQIFNVHLVEQLNTVKTPEEIDPVSLDEDDVRALTTSDVRLASKIATSVNKYRKKMQSLLCLVALIVFHDITYFEVTWFGFAKGVDVQKIDAFVTRMIAVFYVGKVFVPNWFWTACIKLKALLADKAGGRAGTDFFDDSKHMFDLWSYCKLCQRRLYLLPGTADRYGSVLKFARNACKSTDEFVQSHAQRLYDCFEVDAISEKEELFTLTNFRLYHFKEKHLWFFDTDIRIDWTRAKIVLLGEWDKIRLSVTSWLAHPYDSVGYQECLMRLVNLHVFYYTWVHLTIYSINILRFTDRTDETYAIRLSDAGKSEFKALWSQFDRPLGSALQLLGVSSGPLWQLSWLMDPDRLVGYTDFKQIYIEVNSVIAEELKYLDTDGSGVVKDSFDSSNVFRRPQLMSSENVKSMENYIAKIKYILKPFDYHFLKFYSMGKLNKIPIYEF